MTLEEIREEAWDVARDNAEADENRLWKQAEMNRYINRTYRQIARETRCIKDAVTPAVCLIPVVPVDYTTYPEGSLDALRANDESGWLYQQNVAPFVFPLHDSILEIDEVKWMKKAWALTHVSVTKWQRNPFWEQVIGLPIEYCTDYSNKTIAVNYRAVDSDTLILMVKRMPLADLVADSDVPEIRSEYHDLMLAGILAQMYSKQDAECADAVKASSFAQEHLLNIDKIKRQETVLNRKLNPNAALGAFR